tara:strand:- start:77 stop:928 length:852 start_codon:yes stop_codon:yes gene_type:complete
MADPSKNGMGGMAARMAGLGLPSIPDEENNQINFVPQSTSDDRTSGTNIIKGIKDFYNLADQSGLLTEDKVNETKENLLNIAEENKNENNKSESEGDTTSSADSKLLSHNFQGLDPRKDIFNYDPQANIGFNVGDQDGGLYATGDLDASLKGVNTNLQAGFKNKNFDVSYNPERGLNLGFNEKFGDNTNININQSNGNFNPSLNTNIRNTDIALNPNKLDLNKTFEIGNNTNVNVGGEVDFDGQTKADLEVTRDFLNKQIQLYGGADTEGDFKVGAKFNFLNL